MKLIQFFSCISFRPLRRIANETNYYSRTLGIFSRKIDYLYAIEETVNKDMTTL